MNVNPRDLTIRRWCDQMVMELARFGQAPYLGDEMSWRQWGQEVNKLPGVAGHNPPDPHSFEDFYSWAEQFNLAVRL